MGDNEVMGSTARSERDEDAEVDVWSDKEGYDPKSNILEEQQEYRVFQLPNK